MLDENGREHFFQSTMIKAYRRLNPSRKDLLNQTANDPMTNKPTQLVEIVHDKRDPRYNASRQKEYGGIDKKGGGKVIPRATLSEMPMSMVIVSCSRSKSQDRQIYFTKPMDTARAPQQIPAQHRQRLTHVHAAHVPCNYFSICSFIFAQRMDQGCRASVRAAACTTTQFVYWTRPRS